MLPALSRDESPLRESVLKARSNKKPFLRKQTMSCCLDCSRQDDSGEKDDRLDKRLDLSLYEYKGYGINTKGGANSTGLHQNEAY